MTHPFFRQTKNASSGLLGPAQEVAAVRVLAEEQDVHVPAVWAGHVVPALVPLEKRRLEP
jgi:hypothetical protein